MILKDILIANVIGLLLIFQSTFPILDNDLNQREILSQLGFMSGACRLSVINIYSKNLCHGKLSRSVNCFQIFFPENLFNQISFTAW